MTRIADLVDVPSRGTPTAAPVGTPLSDGFSVVPWTDCTGADFEAAWLELGLNAETPNPFSEQWFLLPSLRQFDAGGQVQIATLVAGCRLVALMPIWHDRDYHGRFLPHLASWLHANIFCGEPLVAPGYSDEFWQRLLDWCDTNHRASAFLHLGNLPTDGRAYGTLETLTRHDGRCFVSVKRVERAALRHGLSPEEHLASAMGSKRRSELRRKRRRLEDSGSLVFSRHNDDAGLDHWIDEFLELERAGWKGSEGSSLASASETEALFREAISGAAANGRLERLAFHLDGQPVAMLCSLVAPPFSFGFKTAFDERFGKLSPGLLLQVENLAVLERPDIALCDSCSAPGHSMIEQIWTDRRELAMVTVGIGGKLRRRIGAALSAIELRRQEKRG